MLVHFVMRRVASAVSIPATKRLMSTMKRMDAQKFDQILKSNSRYNYQIVDVREKLELDAAQIPGDDVIHLPLSDANAWSQEILEGKILDSAKPTLCLCHHGVRSSQLASFLVSKAGFKEVYNVEGGIHAYATEADPSVPVY